jgi:hypothetical protein
MHYFLFQTSHVPVLSQYRIEIAWHSQISYHNARQKIYVQEPHEKDARFSGRIFSYTLFSK